MGIIRLYLTMGCAKSKPDNVLTPKAEINSSEKPKEQLYKKESSVKAKEGLYKKKTLTPLELLKKKSSQAKLEHDDSSSLASFDSTISSVSSSTEKSTNQKILQFATEQFNVTHSKVLDSNQKFDEDMRDDGKQSNVGKHFL